MENINSILRKFIILFVLPYLLVKVIITNNYLSFYSLTFLVIYIFLTITHKSKKETLITILLNNFLYSVLLIFWSVFCAIPISMIYLYVETAHFCDYIKQGINISDEMIDVSLGSIKKISGRGMQDGECMAIISYRDNPEYIKNKLLKLDGKLENNCEAKLKHDLPDIENSYMLSNDCIFLKIGQVENGEVETFLYDQKSNNLFYEYINR